MNQTPGKEVQQKTVIQKTRRLPITGEVLAKRGENVTPNTIVARTYIPNSEVHLVKIYAALGVAPRDVTQYILKGAGDEVQKDEVIARYQYFFGLLQTVCKAPIDGTIETISEVSGEALIKGSPILVEVNAHIPGRVVEILPMEGVIIEVTAATIQGVFGIDGETHGDLVIVVDSPHDILSPSKIHGKYKDKILVGGSLVTLQALRKASEIGVNGIIVGGIEQKDLVTFLGYEIGMGITGNENVGLTVILTEGFGKLSMKDEAFQLLNSFAGKQASINGSTHIRLRRTRPEIILPLKRESEN